jgi:hypothetical protein
MGGVLEPLQSVVKSVGDGLKDIKLPDNPLKDVSFGNKLRNFRNGVRSGLMGPREARVQVSTGRLGLGRTYRRSSVSSTPISVSGLVGDFAGNKIGRMGRTGTKPIFSSNTPKLNSVIPSKTPSFVERMKQTFTPIKTIKTTKTTNIGNIELSNMSQQPQPPQEIQEIQQAGKKKKSSKKEKKPSKKEKKPPKKETTPSKKEKKPPKKEKTPPKKEKKSSKK